jgi:hypothetical protein
LALPLITPPSQMGLPAAVEHADVLKDGGHIGAVDPHAVPPVIVQESVTHFNVGGRDIQGGDVLVVSAGEAQINVGQVGRPIGLHLDALPVASHGSGHP